MALGASGMRGLFALFIGNHKRTASSVSASKAFGSSEVGSSRAFLSFGQHSPKTSSWAGMKGARQRRFFVFPPLSSTHARVCLEKTPSVLQLLNLSGNGSLKALHPILLLCCFIVTSDDSSCIARDIFLVQHNQCRHSVLECSTPVRILKSGVPPQGLQAVFSLDHGDQWPCMFALQSSSESLVAVCSRSKSSVF